MLPRRETVFLEDDDVVGVNQSQRDAHHQWFSDTTGRPENIRQCCLLGSRLFLKPEAVLHWCLYWLSQYSNYDLEERDWLIDMIHGLLYESPQLRVIASETSSLGNVGHMTLRASQLLRFAGTDSHAIPLEQVIRTGQFQILQAFSVLLQSDNQCFLSRSDDSLDGELALDGFLYDTVLREFYEPGFIITTLYRMYLCELIHNTGAQSWQDVLPRHMHSLKAIAYDSIDWDRVERALGQSMMSQLQQELLQLYQSLDVTHLEQALEDVTALWSEKASYCDYESRQRPVRVLQRLSPQQ